MLVVSCLSSFLQSKLQPRDGAAQIEGESCTLCLPNLETFSQTYPEICLQGLHILSLLILTITCLEPYSECLEPSGAVRGGQEPLLAPSERLSIEMSCFQTSGL